MEQRRNATKYVRLLLYCCILFLPFAGILGQRADLSSVLPNARRLGLLANSITLGGAVTVLTTVLGFFAALGIANGRLAQKWYRYFFLLFLAIPYYVYALSWMILIRFLSGFRPSLLKYSMQGLPSCLFVEVMTYLPLAVLFCLAAIEMTESRSTEMALVFQKPETVLQKQLLPQSLPLVASGMGCIFLLSVTDFSVPSMFQYNTYTLEIYSVYSRTGSALDAWIMALPVALVLLLPLSLVQRGIRRIPGQQKNPGRIRMHYAFPIRAAMKLGLGLLALQAVVPLLVFLVQTGSAKTLWRSFLMIREQLRVSVEVALLASVLTFFLIGLPAAFLERCRSPLVWMLLSLPMVLPGAILAMGLLSIVNRSVFHPVGSTVLLPALGCALHYLPFALLLLMACRKRVDVKKLEMAAVMSTSGSRYRRMERTLLLPGYLCASCLVFFLSLGEEGIELVLMPPGMETASVKIYNYLHYGASEYVAGFCLITVLLMLAAECLILWLIRRRFYR